VVERSGDLVWITDGDGVIEYVNPRFTEVTGYTPEEAYGRTGAQILASGLHGPGFYQDMWQRLAGGESFQATFLNRSRDGRLLHLEETISPLWNPDGTIRHYVATARDVTDFKAAEERIQ
ncbi:MAG: PAS domain S-box protein, partial [Gemmatimonadetes bacterium]|nr:PAS domain S-box protein [Gemmatimonadota bacterium]NIW66583.1 PAS domain S-box protein [Gemmatimonadota bacterium]